MRDATRRLLLVGWPSAEWDSIHPLLDAGRLPFLAGLIERGATGSLAPTLPHEPASLWTTLATGVLPDRHGVTAAWEVRPDRGGIQPAGRRSWRAPAFWEMLEADGLSTATVAWPATAPADRWPGRHVDSDFACATGADFSHWPMPPHAVSPASLRAELALMRVHPADDSGTYLRALLPRVAELPTADRRLAALAQVLAQAATVHAVATHFAAAGTDVLCVCYALLSQVKGGTTPEDERPDSVFAGLAERIHQFLDMMLGRLVELMGEGATIIVASADGRSARQMREACTPRGLVIAAGPDIPPDSALPAAGIADLAPTILARFWLAAPMDGRPIQPLVQPGITVRHVEVPAVQTRDALFDPALALIAQGYADRIQPDQARAMGQAESARLFNLSEAQMTRGNYADATATLEALLRFEPRHVTGLQRLAQCRALLGDPEACEPIGQALLEIDPSLPWGHLVLGVWCVLTRDHARADTHLEQARGRGVADPRVLARLGGIELLRARHQAAGELFADALRLEPDLPEALYGLGIAKASFAEWPAAERAARRAIGLQPFHPQAYLLLGRALGAQERWREAIAALETALAQRPDLAEAPDLLNQARHALAKAVLNAAERR